MVNIQVMETIVKTINDQWKLSHTVPKTKKYLVLDTERGNSNGFSQVGMVVCDKEHIYYDCQIMVDNKAVKSGDLAGKSSLCKKKDYMTKYSFDFYAKPLSLGNFIQLLFTILNRWNIKVVYCWNPSADKTQMKKVLGDYWYQELDNKVNWYDLTNEIFVARLNTRKYVNYCIDNDYLTSNGNITLKFEIVYRYVMDNRVFQQSHIAIDDARKETEVLQAALKAKRKRQKSGSGCQLWRELEKLR